MNLNSNHKNMKIDIITKNLPKSILNNYYPFDEYDYTYVYNKLGIKILKENDFTVEVELPDNLIVAYDKENWYYLFDGLKKIAFFFKSDSQAYLSFNNDGLDLIETSDEKKIMERKLKRNMRQYIDKNYDSNFLEISRLEINFQKNITISIYLGKPGFFIGKCGRDIIEIEKFLSEKMNKKVKFLVFENKPWWMCS